ncbi:hypothetical protein LINPERPRIM_LOCUS8975, partial [Linum perenne]
REDTRVFQRAWEVEITHIYREGNHVVDYLASIGHEMQLRAYNFPIFDPLLAYWSHYDVLVFPSLA